MCFVCALSLCILCLLQFVIINQSNGEVENPENAQIIMEKYFDTLEENNSPRNILYSHLLEIYKYFCESLLEAGSVESGSFDHLMSTFGRSVIDSGLFTCLAKLICANKLTFVTETLQRNICLVAIDIVRLFTNRMHTLSHIAHQQLVTEEEDLLKDFMEMLLDEKISEFYRCLILSILVDLSYSKCGLDWIVKQEQLFSAIPKWFLAYNDFLESGVVLKPSDTLNSQSKAMLAKPMYKKLVRSLKSGSLHILTTVFYPMKISKEVAESVGGLLMQNGLFRDLATKFYQLSLPFLAPIQHKDFMLFNSSIAMMVNGTIDVCLEEFCKELQLFNSSTPNSDAILSLRHCGIDNSLVSPVAFLIMFAISIQQRVFQLEHMLRLFGNLLISNDWTRELLCECVGTELVDISFYGRMHEHSVYGDIRMRNLHQEDRKFQQIMVSHLIKPLLHSNFGIEDKSSELMLELIAILVIKTQRIAL